MDTCEPSKVTNKFYCLQEDCLTDSGNSNRIHSDSAASWCSSSHMLYDVSPFTVDAKVVFMSVPSSLHVSTVN